MKVKVETYLGTSLYCTFPIDLSTVLPFVAQVEHRRPRPVLEVPGIDPLPEFTLYPLPDQVADKVCAMYERHGRTATPSSRFRDLVDLVLIVSNFELDAAQTIRALTAESRRRDLALPARLETPDPTWLDGYREAVRGTSLLRELHELPAALLAAGACLDPLLARKITTGVWEPQERRWRG